MRISQTYNIIMHRTQYYKTREAVLYELNKNVIICVVEQYYKYIL